MSNYLDGHEDQRYVESEKDRKDEVKKRRKGKGPTITEIAIEARKEHLTYGQYVAKYGL